VDINLKKAWGKVGDFIKEKGSGLVAVAGSVLTGNIPGGIAAAASMLLEATGESDPEKVLDKLQKDPSMMSKMNEIALKYEVELRKYNQQMLVEQYKDVQSEHKETQDTIRAGDKAQDEYVRRTRPLIARISFIVGCAYMVGMEALNAFSTKVHSGADVQIAMVMFSPAWAYMGLRTWDKVKGQPKFVK